MHEIFPAEIPRRGSSRHERLFARHMRRNIRRVNTRKSVDSCDERKTHTSPSARRIRKARLCTAEKVRRRTSAKVFPVRAPHKLRKKQQFQQPPVVESASTGMKPSTRDKNVVLSASFSARSSRDTDPVTWVQPIDDAWDSDDTEPDAAQEVLNGQREAKFSHHSFAEKQRKTLDQIPEDVSREQHLEFAEKLTFAPPETVLSPQLIDTIKTYARKTTSEKQEFRKLRIDEWKARASVTIANGDYDPKEHGLSQKVLQELCVKHRLTKPGSLHPVSDRCINGAPMSGNVQADETYKGIRSSY